MVTDEELRKLLAEATPGPWVITPDSDEGEPANLIEAHGYFIATTWGGYNSAPADTQLIAATPDLASEVLRLREENARLREDSPFICGANDGYAAAMKQVAEESRRYASHYPQASDGRNTFVLLAEWAERAAMESKP